MNMEAFFTAWCFLLYYILKMVALILTKYIWESNISSMEDMKILSVTPALEVNFHCFGESRDSDRIRGALNRLVQRRRLGEFFLEPSHFTFQQKPALQLQSLKINQINEHRIQLDDQFTLSCIAVGSSDLTFSWFKDDMLVNMSKATREIWYRHLPNDGSDYHTSVLTVDKATRLDEGVYTCQVLDWGVQQCASLRLGLRPDPLVKVVPMSSTVEKGATARLTCTTPNLRSVGIGFGWTKNRALLRLRPGQEVWEDLYPAGSILTVSSARQSAVYTCALARRSASARLEVVERGRVPLCPGEARWGLAWPETAPGARALLGCPRGFLGERAERRCRMRDAESSEWDLPDFSGCLHEALGRAYSKFQSLTLGYESTNGSSTIQAFWDVLQYRRSSLYPGEGDRIISLLEEVEHYQYNIEELDDLKNSAEAMMRVIDKVLSNDNSILSQQKLVLLSQLVLRNLGYWSQDHIEPDKHLPLSQVVVNVLPMKLYSSSAVMYSLTIPQDNQNKYPDWYNERVTIRLYHNSAHNVNKTVSGIIVVYRNLAQFFPNAYVTELEDGSDLEYRIGSRIVSVATSQRAASRHERLAIELEFEGALNGSGAWNASCGVLGPDGAWNLDGCSLGEAGGGGAGAVHCLCSSPGTFAAFLTARSEKVTLARNNQTNFVVVLGCGSCLLQCLITALVLTAFWWRNRTWLNFLKIQCCAAVVAAMATFIYAVQADIVEDDLSIVAMCLEAFLLIGTSSPISQALIIYAELSNIHPSRQLQPTVVAVITGVPILAILTTELTRKTIGWKHESWWLIFNSGVYNIFVISSITLLLTFILLYITVIHKTRPLLYKFKRKDIIQLRVRMLHRSALVIFGILAMEISSVFYINSPLIIYHYVFAFQSALLGFIILAMYVMSGEVLVVAPVLHKLKHQAESDDECASAQTKVRSNVRDLEREPSSASSTGPGLATTTVLSAGLQPLPVYPEPRGVAAGIDAREYVTEAAAGAYAAATRLAAPEILIHRVDDVLLEAYGPASRFELVEPARFLLQQQPASTTATGLEGYATMEQRAKPYQELASLTSLPPSADLQQQHQQQHQLQSSLSPGTATSVLCSAQVETCLSSARAPPPVPDVTLAVNGEAELLLKKPLHGLIGPNRPDDLGFEVTSPTATTTTTTAKAMPDITNTMEQRKQPDGEDILLKSKQRHGSLEALDERRPTGFVTNGMLDRISHDLDYLLNRTKESA